MKKDITFASAKVFLCTKFIVSSIQQLISEKKYHYGKEEKLKSRKQIEKLFAEGKHINAFPVKAIYLSESAEVKLQAGVSVSSRYFKKAVDRNRIKRLMREAYRLQKESVQNAVQEKNKQLSLFLIYTGNEVPDYETIYVSVKKILNKLIKILHAEG